MRAVWETQSHSAWNPITLISSSSWSIHKYAPLCWVTEPTSTALDHPSELQSQPYYQLQVANGHCQHFSWSTSPQLILDEKRWRPQASRDGNSRPRSAFKCLRYWNKLQKSLDERCLIQEKNWDIPIPEPMEEEVQIPGSLSKSVETDNYLRKASHTSSVPSFWNPKSIFTANLVVNG